MVGALIGSAVAAVVVVLVVVAAIAWTVGQAAIGDERDED